MHSILKEITDIQDYIFPFEGEEHLTTIMILPYREDTWRSKALPAYEEFLEVVKAIAQYEMVTIIAHPKLDYSIVKRFQMKNTHILRLEYEDCWARDTLPIFLKNDKEKLVCGVDFAFNAWGGEFNGLYSPYDNDDALGKFTCLDLMLHRYPRKHFVLEGGSVHSDGEGTLLTTKECLLSKGRNPSLSLEEIEEELKKDLRVEKVLFLPYGIVEDETDGHVDNMACFLAPSVILLAWCEEQSDPQYERCLANEAYLKEQRDAKGREFTIIHMPLPKVQYSTQEECDTLDCDPSLPQKKIHRLAASYVNFYMGKDFIILPQFHDEKDEVAVKILKDYYQGTKTIHPIYSREILLGGGNIHCITKNVPFYDHYEIEPKEEVK